MTDHNVRYINLRGIAPLSDGRHAEVAENVYLDKGVVRKRKGYSQTVKFDGPVDGVSEVVVGSTRYVLVYAGKRFYLRDKSAEDKRENYVDVTLSGTSNRVDGDRLEARRIQTYCQSDKAYIVGCGDYLVLKKVGDRVELRRVEDEEDTHVPTTTVGIGCKDSDVYIETTVDEDSVGVFYVEDGAGGYQAVTLDGDEQLPDPTLTYYLKVTKSSAGEAAEPRNLLNSYRKNTLYGTAAGEATYRLDVDHVDPDSNTAISVDVLENGAISHYDLVARSTGNVTRAPIVGDDLSGVTLTLSNRMLTGVGSLHLVASRIGIYERVAEGGYLRWECTGTSSSAWNTALLKLHTSLGTEIVATATRANLFGTYTVNWSVESIDFPDTFGVIESMGAVFERTDGQGSLPRLETQLRCGAVDWGVLDYRNGTVTFAKPTTPAGAEDNITVYFRHREKVNQADKITGAKVSVQYGVGGNSDRLFVGGADVSPTTDYVSESADWTYFAPDGGRVLGTEGAVKAYVATNMGLLTLLSAPASPNAYWRVGEWVTETPYLGTDAYRTAKASFRLVKTATLPKPAGDGGVGYLDSDSLYLAENGIYRILTNALTDDKKAMRLSAPIDGATFGEACTAVVHDLRYYVSTGHEVYVGDSRYRVALDSDSGYEWSTYGIEGVRVWYVMDGVLCFGTEDGRLCHFDNAYEDVTFEDIAEGQLTVDAENGRLTYDRTLTFGEGDELYLEQSLYAVKARPVDLDGERVYVDSDAILNVYEGEEVCCVAGGVLGGKLYVKDVDWGKCCFGLEDAEGVPYTVPNNLEAVLSDLMGRKTICREVSESTCRLATRYGVTIELYGGVLPNVLTARLVHRRPVAATYAAVTNALSTPDLTKVLLSATVEVESEKAGEATFGVRTSADREAVRVLGLHVLRYDWMDLGAFAFDGKFPRAHTARLRLRFHYLQWKIQSNNAGDLAIRGVCLRYRYLKPAKGVSD